MLLRIVVVLLALGGCAPAGAAPVGGTDVEGGDGRWGIVVHGGAGTIDRAIMTAEMERQYREALERSLRAGHAVLARGGSASDAVTAAVHVLEDSPLFNAGKGAVFTAEGKNELDAAFMDGRTRAAGAVAGVTRVKNPIDLARAVMERSPHVMLVGTGAEAFAREQGIEMVEESYFFTEHRWRQLQEAKAAERSGAAADDPARYFGTVGAVALDQQGNLAAGTSTGGMTNKKWGRVGDAPVIGAGTYADNRCGGISATGHGEFFIRSVVAYDVCAITLYTGIPLRDAADQVVMEKLVRFGGEGGLIAMDPQGNVSMPFNSSGMYRGLMMDDGKVFVEIYRE